MIILSYISCHPPPPRSRPQSVRCLYLPDELKTKNALQLRMLTGLYAPLKKSASSF